MSGREHKRARARALWERGARLRDIASELGISTSTAFRWTHQEAEDEGRRRSREWKARNRERTRAYDREYLKAHKGTCTVCGGRMGGKDDGICRDCRAVRREAVGRELERLWAAGLTYPELCAHFGWTRGHLSAKMARYRDAGFDLPYRYRKAATNGGSA